MGTTMAAPLQQAGEPRQCATEELPPRLMELCNHLADGGIERAMRDAPVIDLDLSESAQKDPKVTQSAKEDSLEDLCTLLSQQMREGSWLENNPGKGPSIFECPEAMFADIDIDEVLATATTAPSNV